MLMHELAIAESIVGIVLANAGGRHVTRIEVTAGALPQVLPSALSFAVEMLVQGTAAEGAPLSIMPVAAAGRCRSCGAETTFTAFPFLCASCGGAAIEVTAGEELRVAAIEVD